MHACLQEVLEQDVSKDPPDKTEDRCLILVHPHPTYMYYSSSAVYTRTYILLELYIEWS